MHLGLAMAAILAAGAAQALTPIPECNPGGAEAEAGVIDYSVAWHGGGFVFYGVYAAAQTYYLDDCRGDRRLIISPIKGRTFEETSRNEQAVWNAVDGALRSSQGYTMAQVAALARKAGARTRLGAARYDSCACVLYGAQD